MIFETHAHYDDRRFDPDREELLASMQENKIDKIINVGSDLAACKKTLELIKEYDFVYGAIGIHPSDIADLSEDSFLWLKTQMENPKVLAVGEIGLDYYWEKEEQKRELQKFWFKRQLELAKEAELPVIIHSRDAAADTLEIIKTEHANQGKGGVIHCFSYSKEMALSYVEMGYYIGIGGVSTFKNAKKLKEAIKEIPLERILLETDCPYMAPEPHRGQRNSSLYLPYVVEQIAELKSETSENVEEVTYENAKRLFQIKESR